MSKNPSLIDVPVALIFFNRPEVLKSSFNAIRKARPSKVFLIQDGPREERPNDIERVEMCRRIVKDIDWECEVYKDYSEVNLGCGMRVYSGISWAFQYVDRLIILEDDIVPSNSMFTFCEEILERFKDDQRMQIISGMNHLGEYTECPYDYFFSTTGSIWGWATWRRAWKDVDYELKFLDNKYFVDALERTIYPSSAARRLLRASKKMRKRFQQGEKLSSWSLQHGMAMYLNTRLIIIPKKNLTCNIGLTDDSVHAVNKLRKIPKALQRVFFMKTFELDFPIMHPEYVINDINFLKRVYNIMGNHILIKWYRKVEGRMRRLIFCL